MNSPQNPTGALSQQVIAITGSTRGVGLCVARAVAEQGATVVLHGRDQQQVDELAEDFSSRGLCAVALAEDFSHKEGPSRWMETLLSTCGRIDALVNNAGITGPLGPRVWDCDPSEWAALMTINVEAPVQCAQLAVQWMRQHQVLGRVLNVSSGAAAGGFPGFGPYCVSKTALEAAGQAFSAELEAQDPAIVTLRLSSLKTEMTRACFEASSFDQLPEAHIAVPLFLTALTAPIDAIRGRTLSLERYLCDPEAEVALHSPLSTVQRKTLPVRLHNQEPVERSNRDLRLLDRGENRLGPPPSVRKTLGEYGQRLDIARYPTDESYGDLRRGLAARLELPEECLTFGNGSSELVERAVRTFAGPGLEVISHFPTWFMFDRYCQSVGAAHQKVLFSEPSGQLGQNLGGVVEAITPQTRLIYLVSPANPIGIAIKEREFLEFLEQVPQHLPVVVDEAYVEWSDRDDTLRCNKIVLNTDHRLIALRTFSKFYGLAGLRVGYGYASPETMALFNRLEVLYGVPSVSAAAALDALNDEAYAKDTQQTLCSERRRIEQKLLAAGVSFVPVQTALVPFASPIEPKELMRRLESRGIFIPREAFAGNILLFPISEAQTNDDILAVIVEAARERGIAPVF